MKKYIVVLVSIIIIGFILPENFQMPVEGASKNDYNPKSFWYYPWGRSITHKGIDIYGKLGRNIKPATNGFVIYSGQFGLGGNVVIILGAKWRIHYYAHLQETDISSFSWVNRSRYIGKLGSSGNASGKSPHLHYSIISLFPYFWRIDNNRQAWKKMFYLNPIDYLESK
ncbi:MAG: M23 family metallopeptidase [Marinifilaceae bacterium]|jgi:murein DD-endopeptidase MepM/ murein hydrolase activator NlpD|nr:M23 family metallopeptidase [Marinifilaceae bacterium]